MRVVVSAAMADCRMRGELWRDCGMHGGLSDTKTPVLERP